MLALGLAGADQRAVIHDVVMVDESLVVAFYSTNGGVRAAVSDGPSGVFTAVPDFKIEPTDPWEKEGGEKHSLESNGAHVLIEDTGQALILWLGYDSYHVDRTTGQLGWAKIRIDKGARNVSLLEKHPQNPLAMLPADHIAARCGGNLASSIRISGEYAFLYYSRLDKSKITLNIALSHDPLFQHITRIVEFEPPLADEVVIEKFEAYVIGEELHIIYETQLASGLGVQESGFTNITCLAKLHETPHHRPAVSVALPTRPRTLRAEAHRAWAAATAAA